MFRGILTRVHWGVVIRCNGICRHHHFGRWFPFPLSHVCVSILSFLSPPILYICTIPHVLCASCFNKFFALNAYFPPSLLLDPFLSFLSSQPWHLPSTRITGPYFSSFAAASISPPLQSLSFESKRRERLLWAIRGPGDKKGKMLRTLPREASAATHRFCEVSYIYRS